MFVDKFKDYGLKFESYLKNYMNNLSGVPKRLNESLEYSLFSGGKRIRPIIAMTFCEVCKKSIDDVLPFAAAIEMIHTYSLIHDDLPCMDNDILRRGKPCNHIAYGESTALLAGDALLTEAFAVCALGVSDSVTYKQALKSIAVISRCAGCCGMVGGQYLDLNSDGKDLTKIYKLKTAALISASAEVGATVGGAGEKQITAARMYGEKIGLAFQIVDDILDNDAKLQESDSKCRLSKLANELTLSAQSELKVFDSDTSFLFEFADFLKQRTN